MALLSTKNIIFVIVSNRVIWYNNHGFNARVSEYTTCHGGCSGTLFLSVYWWQYTGQSRDVQAEQHNAKLLGQKHLGKLPEQLTIIFVLNLVKFSNWIFFKLLLNSLFFSSHFSLTAKNFFVITLFSQWSCVFSIDLVRIIFTCHNWLFRYFVHCLHWLNVRKQRGFSRRILQGVRMWARFRSGE